MAVLRENENAPILSLRIEAPGTNVGVRGYLLGMPGPLRCRLTLETETRAAAAHEGARHDHKVGTNPTASIDLDKVFVRIWSPPGEIRTSTRDKDRRAIASAGRALEPRR